MSMSLPTPGNDLSINAVQNLPPAISLRPAVLLGELETATPMVTVSQLCPYLCLGILFTSSG